MATLTSIIESFVPPVPRLDKILQKAPAATHDAMVTCANDVFASINEVNSAEKYDAAKNSILLKASIFFEDRVNVENLKEVLSDKEILAIGKIIGDAETRQNKDNTTNIKLAFGTVALASVATAINPTLLSMFYPVAVGMANMVVGKVTNMAENFQRREMSKDLRDLVWERRTSHPPDGSKPHTPNLS